MLSELGHIVFQLIDASVAVDVLSTLSQNQKILLASGLAPSLCGVVTTHPHCFRDYLGYVRDDCNITDTFDFGSENHYIWLAVRFSSPRSEPG